MKIKLDSGIVWDLVALAGLVALVYGVSLFSRPVAWIVGGALLAGLGVLAAPLKASKAMGRG